MSTITMFVQGSAASPYRVTFDIEPGKLLAFCTCEAGSSGQHCKHRLAILAGSVAAIVDHDPALNATVLLALVGTPLQAALIRLAEAEAQVEAAKRSVSAAKKRVAAEMRG